MKGITAVLQMERLHHAHITRTQGTLLDSERLFDLASLTVRMRRSFEARSLERVVIALGFRWADSIALICFRLVNTPLQASDLRLSGIQVSDGEDRIVRSHIRVVSDLWYDFSWRSSEIRAGIK